MPRYDAIVIGLGAMGSSAAYHLARRGRRVLGLEQFDIPNSQGSSHGYSRMIRLCYYEHPDYVPLLKRAYRLWHELEHAAGQRLLFLTGGLYIGDPTREFVERSRLSAVRHGLPHEMLTRADIADRYRQFRLPNNYAALYEPNAGFLLPERVVAAQAGLALQCGAELHAREPVLEWTATPRSVRVVTARGAYEADRLVLCPGAWAEKAIPGLSVRVTPTRQTTGWVWPRRPELFDAGTLPVWAIDNPDGSIHYGFPLTRPGPGAGGDSASGPGGLGLKVAHHRRAEETDPDSLDTSPHPDDEGTFRSVLTRHLPDADGPLLGLRVCMYANTPDSHFVVDLHPFHPNVVVACGFSGHGFKFASVIGEVLADLAIEKKTAHPIGFLSLERFSRPTPAPPQEADAP